jgi:pimeloyl-ACP methyl ester carboxylesterase
MTPQPLYDFGGSGPVLHLAVANGFPPLTYEPILQPLTDRYHVVSLPPRALWPHVGPPPQEALSWQPLADDLLAGLRAYGFERVIGVGHSFGAVVSMRAALAEPGRFRALILLDPTILPTHLTDAVKAARAQGQRLRIPLIDGALNRRHRFASVDEAYTYWRGKPLFQDWSDAAVRRYAESLTRPAADGDGLELAWPREWEAHYYLALDADVWELLPRLRALQLPVLIVQGGTTETYVDAAADQVRALLPNADHVRLPGYGHLFPQAAPEITYQVISAWLAGLPAG